MLGKSHLFYGLTTGAALALALVHPWQSLAGAEAVVAGGIGSLLPDLDEPGSTISNAPRILGRHAQRLLRQSTRHTPLRLLGVLAGALIGLLAGVLNVVSRLLSRLVRFVAGGHRHRCRWPLRVQRRWNGPTCRRSSLAAALTCAAIIGPSSVLRLGSA